MSELHIPDTAITALLDTGADIWESDDEATEDVRKVAAPVVAAVLRALVDDLMELRKQCREDGEVKRAVGIGDALDAIRTRIPEGGHGA